MTRLDQLVPILHAGDAVGAHTLHVRDLLRGHGVESDIFTVLPDARTVGVTRPVGELGEGPVLYQMAVVSDLADLLLVRRGPFAVDYHNITPPWFFAGWDTALTAATAAGRRQLAQLGPRCALAVADSSFNARDMQVAGASPVEVAPVLFDAGALGPPDAGALSRLLDGKGPAQSDWLFVGRVVPNKAQHDLVRAFAAFRAAHAPDARLFLVGAPSSARYQAALIRLIADLGLGGAVRLIGGASPAVLAAYYAAADVFVSASEHEGFCVPIVEAMHHGVPVVAHGSSAVPETVGEGGIVVLAKDPTTLAGAAAAALRDRDRWREAGRRRAAAFSLEQSRARMWDVLSGWLSGRP